MFNSIADIKAANKAIGGHWFDQSSMEFFDSIVYPALVQHPEGAYFISSEKCENSPRLYTVRFARQSGEVNTVGPFQGFASETEALDWAIDHRLTATERGE